MNIYKALEILRNSRIPVFRATDISRKLGISKNNTNIYLKRMIDKELIYRIAKGIYSLEDDPILYASYIIPNSYISFNSALYLRKKIDQIPSIIQVAVPKRVQKKIEGVEFISLPKKKIKRFTKLNYKGYPIWVATAKKAELDIKYKFGEKK